MSTLTVRNLGVTLVPQSARVIVRPFIPANAQRVTSIIGRALALTEEDVVRELEGVFLEFESQEGFTRKDLNASVARVRREARPHNQELNATLRCTHWLADSNYEMTFSGKHLLGERVIFPVSANESNGIEDARFVKFTEDDGTVMYYATYTAYNGHAILPQLIETEDFLHFRVLTLNGAAVQNKGMALFPRRIDGNYVMLSRQDDENLLLVVSDNPHFWNEPKIILRPAEMWEAVKIGNCGSPLELDELLAALLA